MLEAAGALNTDLLVAATGDDEDNLVISLLAKTQFAVPRVLARVNDPDNAWLFDDQWGVDVALPSTMPLIALVEDATGAADTVALGRLTRAGVNVIETAITDTSRTSGHRLAELPLPPRSIIAAVIRHGTPSAPDQNFQLEPGDELLVIPQDATKQDIHKAFQ